VRVLKETSEIMPHPKECDYLKPEVKIAVHNVMEQEEFKRLRNPTDAPKVPKSLSKKLVTKPAAANAVTTIDVNVDGMPDSEQNLKDFCAGFIDLDGDGIDDRLQVRE